MRYSAGEKDDKTPPVTWCPDCNRCVPAVREAAKDKGAYLLEVSVGSSEGMSLCAGRALGRSHM